MRRGHRPKLSLENQLLMMLKYWREYPTIFSLSVTYDIGESNANRLIRWVEDRLSVSDLFRLPGKKALKSQDMSYEVFLVDATETPIERPKRSKKKKNRRNKQKRYYSGKKKRHTIKTQLVVQQSTGKVIATSFGIGKKHDFRLFKESKTHFQPTQKVLVDTGYTGILKLHANTEIPKKRSKNNPLTAEDKAHNKAISKERVLVENIIGDIKKNCIVSERYRNKRLRFSLRFNLITTVQNAER